MNPTVTGHGDLPLGFGGAFLLPLFRSVSVSGCKPVPKLVPARAHKGGETGTVLFSTGQVFSFLSTEPIPGGCDPWEPLFKREPFWGGLSSSIVRSCFSLPARCHKSTFRLPFLRLTRPPSSNMWFKTPAMVSLLGLDVLSLSSRVRNPFSGVLLKVSADALLYARSRVPALRSLSPLLPVLGPPVVPSGEKRLLDLIGRLLPLLLPHLHPSAPIEKESEGPGGPKLHLAWVIIACRFPLVYLSGPSAPAAPNGKRSHIVHASQYGRLDPVRRVVAASLAGMADHQHPHAALGGEPGQGASSSGGPPRPHCPSILAGVNAVRVSMITRPDDRAASRPPARPAAALPPFPPSSTANPGDPPPDGASRRSRSLPGRPRRP